MGNMVAKALATSPLNSLVLTPAKASIRVKSEQNEPESAEPMDAVSLFFEVVAAIGMSEKEAAITMGLDPAQMSRIKSEQARLPFDRMWRLPNRFWLVMRDRIDQEKQLSPENAVAIRNARIAELLTLLLAA